MTFEQAARVQYRRSSFYAVFLVSPDGTRQALGSTQRKTGAGLMNLLRGERAQAIVMAIPGVESVTFKKTASALILSNGYRIEFGGTIRQESV